MIETQDAPAVAKHSSSPTRNRIVLIGIGVVALIILLCIGIVPKIQRHHEAIAAANASPVTNPIVSIIHPAIGAPTSNVVLPGNVEPLFNANLYARVDGYLAQRNVDIGSRVRSGQVLATISAPEVDQQLQQARAMLQQSQAALLQARAALQQSKANAELARLTRERDLPLGERHAISQQIVDSAVQAYDARLADVSAADANVAAATATVSANQANVSRVEQMQAFERITAPFDGVITARNVEKGDLVNASTQTGRPLFSIAQDKTLRIFVDVPQSEALNVRDGQRATIDVIERLGQVFSGTVTRSAAALNDAARTMRTEVQLDNRDGSLLPGMYAQVHFTLDQQRRSFFIPTSALVIDRSGMHVVKVDAQQKIHMAPVTLGKDLGTKVEILAGIDGNDRLVASPNDLLNEGEHVEIQ